MRANGIAYSTGFVSDGVNSVARFDLTAVRRELTVIRDDLHCTAVHLVGGDARRLEDAGRIAAELGLEVWLSPYPIDLPPDEIHALLTDVADRAERIRSTGAEVVLVAGVELSIMGRGFIDGQRIEDRLDRLFGDPAARGARIAEARSRLDGFLRTAVAAIRERFHGRVTYAAIPYEDVDWGLFDVVTLELIRSAEVADGFPAAVRSVTSGDKPVAITGFGTATWRGAADVAPRSMDVLETDPVTRAPVRINGVHERDEAGQAAYYGELLDIFDREGVDSTFPYLFALSDFPHRPDGDPRDDLDLASPGIVKVFDDLTWEPKIAFGTIADFYRTHTTVDAGDASAR
ncbi:hypothetical protein [Actinoplanes sp. NBRC 101535]|uniref:hypothetical protein n=1 Tax=Actinoplanes sp. NBRC 101535 TaxID=3032196 RepID=UPI0024A462D7|nr:hypothetical protein [Actinoplanes sp. NBRC 101535]GLY07138.1 hypothetical protein Acsp01_75170 [Actinoplanes sp. NBRC 101535]